MDQTTAFLVVAVLAIVAIVLGALFARGGGVPVPLSIWKIVAVALVAIAIPVGRNWAGYTLAGLGVLIAIADTARLRRRIRDEAPPVDASDKS